MGHGAPGPRRHLRRRRRRLRSGGESRPTTDGASSASRCAPTATTGTSSTCREAARRAFPYFSPEMFADNGTIPIVEGRQVFRLATTAMPQIVREILERHGLALEDLSLLLMHQANLRINEAVQKALGLPDDKVFNNIQKYGNTTAATLPLVFHEAKQQGRIRPGDLVCFTALGAGLPLGRRAAARLAAPGVRTQGFVRGARPAIRPRLLYSRGDGRRSRTMPSSDRRPQRSARRRGGPGLRRRLLRAQDAPAPTPRRLSAARRDHRTKPTGGRRSCPACARGFGHHRPAVRDRQSGQQSPIPRNPPLRRTRAGQRHPHVLFSFFSVCLRRARPLLCAAPQPRGRLHSRAGTDRGLRGVHEIRHLHSHCRSVQRRRADRGRLPNRASSLHDPRQLLRSGDPGARRSLRACGSASSRPSRAGRSARCFRSRRTCSTCSAPSRWP